MDCDGISSAWSSDLYRTQWVIVLISSIPGDSNYISLTSDTPLLTFTLHLPLWNICIANEGASESSHRYCNAHPHPNDPYHLTLIQSLIYQTSCINYGSLQDL